MSMVHTTTLPDDKQLLAMEEKFDPEMRFRPSVPPATVLIKWLLIILSCFHYYTAGFGLLRETTHRGVHLAFVIGLIFLVFAGSKTANDHLKIQNKLTSPGGIPLYDWVLGIGAAIAVLYIPYTFEDLAFRVGNPNFNDVLFGTVLFIAYLKQHDAAWAGPCRSLLWALRFMRFLGITFQACYNMRGQVGASSLITNTSPVRAYTVSLLAWWPPTFFILFCLASLQRASA
jgi:TRAP-type uncharacterized transport system fused permease subunit